MAILQGDLTECPVPDLLQFLQGTRKDGQLVVEAELSKTAAGVYFASGQIVHASCPPREGAPAVYEILKWTSGRFAFLKGISSPRRTIDLDLQNLLLEGLRQMDEMHVLSDRLPSEDAVLYLERNSDTADDIQLNRSEWKILSLVNGKKTTGQILAESGKAESDAARILYGLLLAGLVTTEHDDSYLAAIVPRKISIEKGSKRRAPPPTILASLLLNKIDGVKSLRHLRDELRCGEKEIAEEIRLLARTEWIDFAAGEDVFRRTLAD